MLLNMHYYPHNIPDFNNATRHLTRVERSVYRDAIERYYDTESVLTKDINSLAKRLLCFSDEEKAALKSILDEFFILTDDGYFHERCEEEIAKYRANTSAKARAGKASAIARQQKLTHVEHALKSVDDVCNKQRTNNQELITNNQELIKEKDMVAKKPNTEFILPDWINEEKWNLWIKTRKGKKMLPEQKQAQVDKLKKWKDAGIDYAQSLSDSADNGWTGLFEPKTKTELSKKSRMSLAGIDYKDGVDENGRF